MQEKDKNLISHQKDKDAVIADLLNADPDLHYILKKVERICSAVFLLTSVMKEGEELRTKMRAISFKIVDNKMSLLGKKEADVLNPIKDLIFFFLELVSYADFSKEAGLISTPNNQIFKDECSKIIAALHARSALYANENISVPSSFFEVPDAPPLSNEVQERASGEHQAKRIGSQNVLNTVDSLSRVAEKKKSRRELILKLLREKSAVSIKEFSSLIQDCSEKTIQRELLEMVEEGSIEKHGERRWSTYSLKAKSTSF